MDLSSLFHRLNNQLGVVLANAELLETRVASDQERARAAQIISGTLDAIGSVQQLKRVLTPVLEPALPAPLLNPSAD